MEKTELKDFLNQIINIIDDKGTKLKKDAGDYKKSVELKREIRNLESSLNNDFLEIGIIVYELYKLGKDIDLDSFHDKFSEIDYKRERISELQDLRSEYFEKPVEKAEEISEEFEEFVEEETIYEEIKCPNCGKINSIYVALCSECGEEL